MIENQWGKFEFLGDAERGNSTNLSGDGWWLNCEQTSEKIYFAGGEEGLWYQGWKYEENTSRGMDVLGLCCSPHS